MIRKGQSQLVAVLSSQSARHRSQPPAEISNSSSVTLLAVRQDKTLTLSSEGQSQKCLALMACVSCCLE
ncbi:uncharacterized [Tachysurus ichikawai]